MSKPIELLGIYLHLAVECERRQRMLERDKLFVMVGIIATQLDLMSVAAYARRQILEHNHGHMVRRWPDFRTALADPDFCHFARQVQRRHPLEKAEGLLQQFEIEIGNERDAYYTDEEYAASILALSVEELRDEVE